MNWTSPKDDGGLKIKSYKLYMSPVPSEHTEPTNREVGLSEMKLETAFQALARIDATLCSDSCGKVCIR